MRYQKAAIIDFSGFASIAQNLSRTDLLVAFDLIERMDMDNRVRAVQKEMAEELGISTTSVNHAFKRLRGSEPPFIHQISGATFEVNKDLVLPNIFWQIFRRSE